LYNRHCTGQHESPIPEFCRLAFGSDDRVKSAGMSQQPPLPRYDRRHSYEWNYDHAPEPVERDIPVLPGPWHYCRLPVGSPIGVAAGPLLNGKWCLYYASLGFDVLTYKTVRTSQRDCYPLPNLVPVDCPALVGGEAEVLAAEAMQGSWAVSFGMPSRSPATWRSDVRWTRDQLAKEKLLSVSVVASVQAGWSLDDMAADYAQCAVWAVESGADVVETNFSCPNVATCDGQLYQQPENARRVAERVRAAIGQVPLVIKIGHITERDAILRLLDALAPSASALAMTNSIASKVRPPGGKPHFEGQLRGICGKATLAASTRQISSFHDLIGSHGYDIDLIGVGGVTSADDVNGYFMAGAHAVQVATGAMTNPLTAMEIRRGGLSPIAPNPAAGNGKTRQ